MHNQWKRTNSGMITVEAALVVPIIILVIVSFIYMIFYAHDIISIRSGAYSLAVENESSKTKIPVLFAISPKIVRAETKNEVKIHINKGSKGNTNFLKNMMNNEREEILTLQKTMNIEDLYVFRAIIDAEEKGDD